MSKYIVLNCPNLTTSWYSNGTKLENQCGITDDDLCKDRKFCLIKKVVGECKETLAQMDKDSSRDAYAGGRCVEAENILRLFEIKEVKEC